MKHALTLLAVIGMMAGCTAPHVKLAPGSDPNAVVAQIASNGGYEAPPASTTATGTDAPPANLPLWRREPKSGPSLKATVDATIDNGHKVAYAVAVTGTVVLAAAVIAGLVILYFAADSHQTANGNQP
jgi:hypothetical protein